ncbi:hypothetical protein SteCoe_6260 [Stentor coeruleus]|uniref:Uncharacterized protein n=1 Tax=Stentor coeruleus TaxID=5963 RepID=A0A1R2CQD8_9CILI|nr:hypothetical protein SteCoe_6260 [Stentor coeruleus]
MSCAKDKIDEKDLKSRVKSRKSKKHRNGLILAVGKPDHQKELYHHQSHTSLAQLSESVPESLLLDRYISKIKDLSEEKQQLLDIIQSNEKEFDFLNHVISQFVDLNELLKIKQKSNYDEISRTWTIPAFIIQQRKTVFPKLQRSQLKEVVQYEIKQRKIKFKPQSVGDPENFNEIIHTNHKKYDIEMNKDDEFMRNSSANYGEFDGRPVTSIAKYRQSSMFNKGIEVQEVRKSPILRKKTNKIIT